MDLLSPHPGLILWTIITFVVVLVILKAKVWGPLLAALDERERSIREALESADRAREEAQTQQAEHEKRLAEAESQARQIVSEAREAAEKVGQQVVADAREEAERTAQRASEAIEAEKRAALAQLRREAADIAVGAAGAILNAELDADRNRKLADDFIASLPDASN
ncbi:MAG: F0F1 ATP synthase subunit B [Candidatus Latescibacteria bacterium]|jgi:F-type H+-transporting ATPase subunit b|nr:ATP synthase F0 subunit B [Gemmatimonadaceae bacterium]MDP7447971.1 F0F1 ATP synthase subunit B [Candidatus Latescibacterota bacterium]HJP32042.1 F0F1 ATP synthase subunit B [Candidatus Latescibacterota bacterium]